MRKEKKEYVSPFPRAFPVSKKKREPEDLRRQATTRNQTRFDEGTLIWGTDDAFPLRLAKTVEDSPAATACLSTRADFIKGAGFSNPDLMKIKVNKAGQTLWSLHCEIVDMLVLFHGFSVNFKFNEIEQITNAYCIDFESLRFIKPDDDLNPNITSVKYNPYFGTQEYQQKYSTTFPLYNPEKLREHIRQLGTQFPGQVYYYGKTKPTHRFYPHPDYWSAEKWMYVDSKIQEAHAENCDNGFFQSVEMAMIGDPNKWSDNPEYKQEYTDANGVKRMRSTKTVGQEFNEQMSQTFSGTSKMGTVFVRWFLNRDDATAAEIREFPNNTNADLFIALQDLTTKNITIATKIPGILANISEGVNLGSTGNEIQKAIELVQSSTSGDREMLMQFYNDTLLPNLDKSLNGKQIKDVVEIVNYNPVTVPIEVDDKFWEVLTQEEKRDFIRNNIPSIRLTDVTYELPGDNNTDEQSTSTETNDVLKNLTGRQLEGIQRIIRKFNKDQLTYEQAKAMLQSGFALTDEQIDIFLIKQEEGNEAPNTLVVSQ